MALDPTVLAVGAALGNVVGAFAVVRQERRGLLFIETTLAFGAGFMIALVLIGVLPEVFARAAHAGTAGALVLLGYVLVHVAQHVIPPHFHFGEETHEVPPSAVYSAVIGLGLHAFFDGVAIASGFLVSEELGLLFFLAVVLHKLPEGVTISSLMLAGGQGRRGALGAGVGLGIATVLGALLTASVATLARYGLALAAGVTLYVAASNLVPEFQATRGLRMTLAFLGGAAALLLLGVLAPVP
ncbi:MAG: ZIP family metal transporter [Gemmatimonadales bacterium]